MWAVMRSSVHTQGTHRDSRSSIESVHDDLDHAIKWARSHCMADNEGQALDVSDDVVFTTGQVAGTPVYGPEDPWHADVFYVEQLPDLIEGPPEEEAEEEETPHSIGEGWSHESESE